MKFVIILRHASGAGGSTFARTLVTLNKNSCICEADDYFINTSGEYQFNPKKLGLAHEWCKRKFEAAIKSEVELIICSNTNVNKRDYQFYVDKAKECGYIVHVVVVERIFDTKDVHNVPQEVIERQKQNLKNSLKL